MVRMLPFAVNIYNNLRKFNENRGAILRKLVRMFRPVYFNS
jgi:hypothetical protein